MSTDETYKAIELRQKYVCSDKDEIGWALGKVQQYAKEHGLLMYVIRRGGFYYMTDMYVPSGKRVAIVYPGGRTELGCCYEGKRPIEEHNVKNTNPDYHNPDYYNRTKTSSDNNKPSISDVSVTPDVLMDIKTGRSVENTNPDYYKDEIITRLKEDAERLASTYVIEVFPHEWVCRGGCHHWARFGEQIDHAPDCPVALHRALMKELE